MNILHIVLALRTGGLERVVLDLISNSSSTTNTYVCCLDDIGDHGDELDAMGVRFFELGNYGKRKINTIISLRNIIKKYQIDVIHTHNPSPHLYGCLAGVLAHVPVVHTKHGRNYPNNRWLVLKNYFFSLLSYKIVCVSSDSAQVALDVEHIPSQKVVTILNGINVEKYAKAVSLPSLRTQIGLSEDCVVLGIVARLSVEKDHTTLLQAMKLIATTREDVILIIVGDGPLRGDLEALSIDLGLKDCCHFLGNRNDIPTLLLLFDIFILCSITEGISLTLLEAMAAKLPIVCTDVGGNPEVVDHEQSGLIVPAKNAEALADKIIELIGRPRLRETMGKAGYGKVRERFDIRKTAQHYDNLYRSAAKRV